MVRKNRLFELMVPQPPAGDQPTAIAQLVAGTRAGKRFQTLLGATGTGKTRTIAHVIAEVQRPTLVVAHNKTLAAQLCNELRSYFPKNAVEYFISYYDHYQPEAYVPSTDTYIEKSANINDEIDKLRHSATRSLFERRDVIVVASVSCIYGLGLPEEYLGASIQLETGASLERDDLLRRLVDIHYERNDMEMAPGRFRVRGDVVEIGPSYEDQVLRIEFFGDEVERISIVDPVTGQVVSREQELTIYPAKHFITPPDRLEAALLNIEEELRRQVAYFKAKDKLLEAQRIFQRTKSDLEMLREFGYCNGVENYSQPLSAREPGSPPNTLLDYFAEDFLLVIDESHVMLPQLRGMYNGDRSRKETLVEYGFRLPSALDNRPLKFDEFMGRIGQTIYVSATPSDFELETSDQVVEQIIRPTGLLDPQVYVRPIEGQIDNLLEEVRRRIEKNERVLITTLTKKSAEDLTDYMRELSLRVRYLHSDIQSLERIEILHDLRAGQFDVLVGVNLLREGLDLPEVSLVVILDADKEGFLRAEKSLVQMIGRAARHQAGEVIMYADNLTNSMERALAETERRRGIQLAYNEKHGITPRTVVKDIQDSILQSLRAGESAASYRVRHEAEIPVAELPQLIRGLEQEMREAAKLLEFERAAELRDKIKRLRDQQLAIEKGSK